MAGKSTFLRQNALIAVLAQMGSYVPAEEARIGVVDRLFSRVGAADDLARGRSTFMVEMVETAAILNQAGPRSLVILDEIGRGTATFDGLSIAWAVVEHLHEVNRCRGLFATHYHELTALAAKLPALACHTMRIKEWEGRIVFLHEVARGTADRSYGIHVARLAGLPEAVNLRAEEVLQALERDEGSSAHARLAEDLPLFAAAVARAGEAKRAEPPPAGAALLEACAAVDPDALTPREALDLVYRLKTPGGRAWPVRRLGLLCPLLPGNRSSREEKITRLLCNRIDLAHSQRHHYNIESTSNWPIVMPRLIVRNLDDDLVRRLQERAAQHGRSTEAEHRLILEEALRPKRSGRTLWQRLSRGERAEVDFGAGVDQTSSGTTFG